THQPLSYKESCFGLTEEHEKTYVLIRYLRTWNDAQTYCRQHYKDLPIIESAEDNANVQASWIGLIDDPKSWKGTMGNDVNSWIWSATGDTSRIGYRNWDLLQPDNLFGTEFCVMMESDGMWEDYPCRDTFHFVCYQGKKNLC
uniref:C-type lectin domain-containing protein n=1 Tax=Acanthochromis polyacanthus TaxID=80966 RepID=A0A3Q1FNX5_9TELE